MINAFSWNKKSALYKSFDEFIEETTITSDAEEIKYCIRWFLENIKCKQGVKNLLMRLLEDDEAISKMTLANQVSMRNCYFSIRPDMIGFDFENCQPLGSNLKHEMDDELISKADVMTHVLEFYKEHAEVISLCISSQTMAGIRDEDATVGTEVDFRKVLKTAPKKKKEQVKKQEQTFEEKSNRILDNYIKCMALHNVLKDEKHLRRAAKWKDIWIHLTNGRA